MRPSGRGASNCFLRDAWIKQPYPNPTLPKPNRAGEAALECIFTITQSATTCEAHIDRNLTNQQAEDGIGWPAGANLRLSGIRPIHECRVGKRHLHPGEGPQGCAEDSPCLETAREMATKIRWRSRAIASEAPDWNTQPAGFVREIASDAGAGKDDDATRHN